MAMDILLKVLGSYAETYVAMLGVVATFLVAWATFKLARATRESLRAAEPPEAPKPPPLPPEPPRVEPLETPKAPSKPKMLYRSSETEEGILQAPWTDKPSEKPARFHQAKVECSHHGYASPKPAPFLPMYTQPNTIDWG